MADSVVQIYNMALSAVGTRSLVSGPDENSREGEVCRLWYNPVRDQVLRAANWASARAVARLALMSSAEDVWSPGLPEPGYLYQYALPADFLYPQSMTDWSRFVLGSTNTGQGVIMANTTDAMLVYTRRNPVVPSWDPDLAMAIAYGLAAAIAMPLHGKAGRAELALKVANDAIMRARVRTANENTEMLDAVPDWLAARGVGLTSLYSRYVYPVGPLLTTSGIGIG